METRIKKVSTISMGVFYTLAGLNHFINPEFYLPLIPSYFHYPGMINIIAGVFEIALGTGVFIPYTRKISSIGIIMMLIAFIPSHIYFIKVGSCIEGGLCVPEWIGWIRLLIIHPLLILWAYFSSK